MSVRILNGDCRSVLATLPDASLQCCVTSPPYFGLRDYGVAGQIGLESSPDAYIAELVAVFMEVRRVLRNDGTLWLNLGDSYNGYMANQRGTGLEAERQQARKYVEPGAGLRTSSAKNKDLLMMPARVALALQADGWWLRSDIIWAKPNPMPESVTDRPTSAHEHVFLLTKSASYFYDADAVAEPALYEVISPGKLGKAGGSDRQDAPAFGEAVSHTRKGRRNCRNVWTIATAPFPDVKRDTAFATAFSGYADGSKSPSFRTTGWLASCQCNAAVVPCTVLDPFAGAFTAPLVADRLQRNAIGIELSPTYCEMARDRLIKDAGMFAEVA